MGIIVFIVVLNEIYLSRAHMISGGARKFMEFGKKKSQIHM